MKRAAIITASDSGYRGEREDLSGPAIKEILEREGYEVISMDILPDDQVMLAGKIAGNSRFRKSGADPDDRRNRIFRARCHTGGNGRSNRAKGSGNTGGNPRIQHDDHKTCDAEPCDSRNPREDTDRKSSGQSESSTGKSGIYYRCTGTRA